MHVLRDECLDVDLSICANDERSSGSSEDHGVTRPRKGEAVRRWAQRVGVG